MLNRMKEDGAISADEMQRALAAKTELAAFERPRRDAGLHFVDHLNREAKTFAGVDGLTSVLLRRCARPSTRRSSARPRRALQEGLARYELNTGRMRFEGAEANLAEAIKQTRSGARGEGRPAPPSPRGCRRSSAARLPLYDVHWPAAVVVDKAQDAATARSSASASPTAASCRSTPGAPRSGAPSTSTTSSACASSRRQGEGQGGGSVRAELRVRPTVQGAALVLENQTGRILAMAGGFSYPLSQLNRATQAHRQPGSTLKPLTYLAALAKGLQPNTLVWDAPVTLPPIGGRSAAARGLLVAAQLRPRRVRPRDAAARARELEEPRHRAPPRRRHRPRPGAEPVARLRARHGGAALPRMRALLPVRARRPAGAAPRSRRLLRRDRQRGRAADALTRSRRSRRAGGRSTRHTPKPPVSLGSADRVAFYQLKTMLQGVRRARHGGIDAPPRALCRRQDRHHRRRERRLVRRLHQRRHDRGLGRLRQRRRQAPHARARPDRRPRSRSRSSSRSCRRPGPSACRRSRSAPPSAEARRQLVDLPIDLRSGDRLDRRPPHRLRRAFPPRPPGRLDETQYRLVPAEQAYASRYPGYGYGADGDSAGGWGDERQAPRRLRAGAVVARRSAACSSSSRAGASLTTPPWWEDEDPRQRRPRRVDPDYFWRNRQIY